MGLTYNPYRYLFMETPALPPMPAPLTYVVAEGGVFLWAKRVGLEALVPVQPCTMRGLHPVQPFVILDGPPRVTTALLQTMLVQGRQAQQEDGIPVEMLFYLSPQAPDWELWIPPQRQFPARVEPIKEWLDLSAYASVVLEIHTHPPNMQAFFSHIDDADEQQGFRLYGVIGCMKSTQGNIEAEIRMRVGIYGVFYEFPAERVLDLPEGLRECVPQDAEAHHQEDERWE